MTSTGSSSATATGTSPMHAISWPMKPIISGLVQIKSDIYAALTGGIPNWDWTNLKISRAGPSSPPRSAPCLTTLVFMNRAKVWMASCQKKRDLFSFQCKLL